MIMMNVELEHLPVDGTDSLQIRKYLTAVLSPGHNLCPIRFRISVLRVYIS